MNVAFIPARGGSKSIPLKNIKEIHGKPLIYWCLKATCECRDIDKTYVATDSDEIKCTINDIVKAEGGNLRKVVVIDRSEESSADTASTESVMIEFAERIDFDNIVLVQATSPLLKTSDLERGFETFLEPNVDSVLSVVKQRRFNWKRDEHGYVNAINYDIYNRPRRQDFEGYFVENGAFYITSRRALIESGNRISGCIKAVEMDEESYYELDEPTDWNVIETLLRKKTERGRICDADIKLFLTDCDGCLTNGGMYYSEYGDEIKCFNTKDGMGFTLLKERGILTGIITGEDVELNKRRANKLRVDYFEGDCKNKVATIKKICKDSGISPKNTCYVGDDLNDEEALRFVGLGCAPADACRRIKIIADFVTVARGGEGAIREIIDLIIRD